MNSYNTLNMPQLISGRGSISFIKSLNKKRIAIIKGGKSYNESIRAALESIAKESHAEIEYIASIRNEPYVEDIFECMEKIHAFMPDLIIGIGGGSVLDTAKAIHLFFENPNLTFEQATIPYSLPKLGLKALHISIPTTSGTGSEATSVAVFIDKKTKVKKLLLDNGLIPHYAVIDADLTDSLPNAISLNTAMDALTHAIESGTARNSNILTKAFSIEAAVMILENIQTAVSDDKTEESKRNAREIVHNASTLAGIAITNSCTGIVHSYDHPGPQYNLPHGAVCALMLPYSISLCGEQEFYKTIEKRLGLTCTLSEHILSLMNTLEMKTSFKEYGIDEENFFANAAIWSKISIDAFATQMAPVHMTEEKGMNFYTMCYFGNEKK